MMTLLQEWCSNSRSDSWWDFWEMPWILELNDHVMQCGLVRKVKIIASWHYCPMTSLPHDISDPWHHWPITSSQLERILFVTYNIHAMNHGIALSNDVWKEVFTSYQWVSFKGPSNPTIQHSKWDGWVSVLDAPENDMVSHCK